MKRVGICLLFTLLGLTPVVSNVFALSPIDNGGRVSVRGEPSHNSSYRIGDELQPKLSNLRGMSPSSLAFREVMWDALLPKGWNPMRMFKNNMMGLNDADPRAMDALEKLRKEWDNAPTEPSMHGVRIRIPGFVVPLESNHGKLREFLLVPYFGACIHTPPPPANQIIHIFSNNPLKNIRTMDAVWVSGTLEIARSRVSENTLGIAGSVGYQMKVEIVEPYRNRY